MIRMLPVAGCMRGAKPGTDPLCDGSRIARQDHAKALATEAGNAAVLRGQRLIALIDAASGH